MENKPIGFRFTGIEILSKYLEEIPKEGISNLFEYNLRLEYRIKAEKQLVMPCITVSIREEGKKNVLAKFSVACLFEIEGFETNIPLNDQGLHTVPNDLGITLNQISVSTTRGVIFSELKGTYLHYAIIPIIYVDNFTPEISESEIPGN